MALSLDAILLIVFGFVLLAIILLNRKQVELQKILFPVLYLILYKTRWGIGLMDRLADRYRNFLKIFGYSCIGIGFLGMIYATYLIVSIMVKFILAPRTTDPGLSIVLPGTYVPGVGQLSFFYWIIGIFIIAVIHEFSHGVIARAHKVEVKSSGFAVFGVVLPIFPAAFVEPNEKKLAKEPDVVQFSIIAAGPVANILMAVIILLLLPYVINPNVPAPFEEKYTNPVGFSFNTLNNTPASNAGIKSGTIFVEVNDKKINDSQLFMTTIYGIQPDQKVKLKDINGTVYTVTASKHPQVEGRGYFGLDITSIRNEKVLKENKQVSGKIFFWFKDLFKWLFLLSFVIGIFNLLPLGPVDGGRMLQIALLKTTNNKKFAHKIWTYVAILLLLLLVVGLVATYLKKYGLF